MQGLVSDKTFHLKWNNHLQNLSQLFTTIYSSSALADVTLSCRDGTLKAHKLVLSACSPYFEQIFRDNPCQHPVVILKGIPFSEINLLVEFMYKGSVDVQELDLQSLMHTASELEIRGLAYEARDNAAQLLNVNLEYPAYTQTTATAQPAYPPARTDVERLKQIHLYQQSMMRAEEIRRRRREDPPTTHTAVNNILAAAAREMEEARHAARAERTVASIQTEQDQVIIEAKREEEDRPKKRPSIMSPEDEKLRVRKKMTVRFQDDVQTEERDRPKRFSSPPAMELKDGGDSKPGGIKVVQLAVLQKPSSNSNDHGDDDEDKAMKACMDDDEETDSSGSISDSAANDQEFRPHVCDVCDQRFQRSSHLSRHRLTHTGERPFTCGGCGRSFARSDKLRVHTKICEKEDPTVDMTNETTRDIKRERNSEVMSGMVRTTHRESGHLVFTPSGDVMLPPRTQPVVLNSTLEPVRNEMNQGDLVDAPRRGRGRPRKTPLPLTPKIKKKRGRPPKTSLDMEGCVLTSGSVVGPSPPMPQLAGGQHHLLMKRKRGRPPKNYHMPRPGNQDLHNSDTNSDLNTTHQYDHDPTNTNTHEHEWNPIIDTNMEYDGSESEHDSVNTNTQHEHDPNNTNTHQYEHDPTNTNTHQHEHDPTNTHEHPYNNNNNTYLFKDGDLLKNLETYRSQLDYTNTNVHQHDNSGVAYIDLDSDKDESNLDNLKN